MCLRWLKLKCRIVRRKKKIFKMKINNVTCILFLHLLKIIFSTCLFHSLFQLQLFLAFFIYFRLLFLNLFITFSTSISLLFFVSVFLTVCLTPGNPPHTPPHLIPWQGAVGQPRSDTSPPRCTPHRTAAFIGLFVRAILRTLTTTLPLWHTHGPALSRGSALQCFPCLFKRLGGWILVLRSPFTPQCQHCFHQMVPVELNCGWSQLRGSKTLQERGLVI